jgi:hypothetical protein
MLQTGGDFTGFFGFDNRNVADRWVSGKAQHIVYNFEDIVVEKP